MKQLKCDPNLKMESGNNKNISTFISLKLGGVSKKSASGKMKLGRPTPVLPDPFFIQESSGSGAIQI
jgi:hypothetical protein